VSTFKIIEKQAQEFLLTTTLFAIPNAGVSYALGSRLFKVLPKDALCLGFFSAVSVSFIHDVCDPIFDFVGAKLSGNHKVKPSTQNWVNLSRLSFEWSMAGLLIRELLDLRYLNVFSTISLVFTSMLVTDFSVKFLSEFPRE
jgi:hypothetical protein